MEGKILAYARVSAPLPQLLGGLPAAGRIREDGVGIAAARTHEGGGLWGEVKMLQSLGLLLAEGEAGEAAIGGHVPPREAADIAMPQPREAREEEGGPERLVGAGRGGQRAQLIEGEVGAVGLLFTRHGGGGKRVGGQQAVPDGGVKRGAQLGEVEPLGIGAQMPAG